MVESLAHRTDVTGAVTGAIAIGAVAFELQTYRLLRRWSSRTVLLIAFGLAFFATAGFAFVHDVGSSLILGVIFGCGFGIAVAATTAVVGNVTQAASRGRAYGLYGMVATLPTIIAPTGGLITYLARGQAVLFGALAIVCLLGFAVTCGLGSLPRHAVTTTKALTVLRNPKVVVALVVYATLSTTYGAVVSFTAFVVHGAGIASPAFFFFAMGISRLAWRLISGALVDRFGERLVGVPSIVIAGVGLGCITLGGAWVAVAAVLYGAGFGSVQTTTIYALLRQSPADASALVGGWWNFAVDGGIGFGAVVFALIAGGLGYELAFRLLPVAMLALFMLWLGDALLSGRRPTVANTASNS